ncbi:MAG: PEP-CTERM sorting domain-containing protein [Armatimonadetes bacterium]|nr:PEP-CTERM sorting domain-containing protein [Armatimonadota bacterium]
MRTLTVCMLMLVCAGHARAEWLYDGYPIYNLGIGIGKGMVTDVVAQPFSVPRAAVIEQIGAAVASGMDPNGAGMRVTLARDYREIEKTALASWRVDPIYGPALMFAYWTVKPIALEARTTYYLAIAPGDSEFMGAAAYAYRGNTALASGDDGRTWHEIAQLGVRVGGTMVPEPSAFVVLGVGCLVLGLRRRIGRTLLTPRTTPDS